MRKELESDFEQWFEEECSIYAAELEGPNSPEYDRCLEKLLSNEHNRQVLLAYYKDKILPKRLLLLAHQHMMLYLPHYGPGHNIFDAISECVP